MSRVPFLRLEPAQHAVERFHRGPVHVVEEHDAAAFVFELLFQLRSDDVGVLLLPQPVVVVHQLVAVDLGHLGDLLGHWRLRPRRLRARWLRTRRQWIEEYVAEKTIKAANSEPDVYTVPNPSRRRQGHIKLKKGGAGYRFLEKLREGDKKKPT